MATTRTYLPPHPAYGLADETRGTILRDAAAIGVKRAARLHRVSDTIIYVWRKRLSAQGVTTITITNTSKEA